MDILQVVEVRQPKVTATYELNGSATIWLDDFEFVRVNYDYRYTDNAHQRALVDSILAALGVVAA